MNFKQKLNYLLFNKTPSVEEQYLNILKDLINKGEVKENRTGTDTLTLPPQTITHNMEDGFPIMTTKKVGFKTLATELEFFIKGLVDKQWLKDRNCKIWNQWCNPRLVPEGLTDVERKEYQLNESRLGPVYGSQWRNFNNGIRYSEIDDRVDYNLPSRDQLKNIIDTLKTNPNDRRMVCSAWNPLALDEQALPPCHLMFIIQHINGVINLTWVMRSADHFLGVPFNVASYGLLLELIARETGMKAGMLTGSLIDVHLYTNHIDLALEQLKRKPRHLPTLLLSNDSIYDFDASKDCELMFYKPHSALKGSVAV